MSQKPRLLPLWLILALMLCHPASGPASNPTVPGPRVWIPWRNVTLPSMTLVRSHQSHPGISAGDMFKAYCSFVNGVYRPGYWQGDPAPPNQSWPWIPTPAGHARLSEAATAQAESPGQRVWVAASGEYLFPPDPHDASGNPGGGTRIRNTFAKWVELGFSPAFTDSDADGLPDDWERHHGGGGLAGLGGIMRGSPPVLVFDANSILTARENSAPSNSSGVFRAGYNTGAGFTAFTDGQHTGAGGFLGLSENLSGYIQNPSTGLACVLINRFPDAITPLPGVEALNPGEMLLHPDGAGTGAAVRFTAPAAGSYSFSATFRGLTAAGNGVDVSVLKGATLVIPSRHIGNGAPGASAVLAGACALAAGESLDFQVGFHGNYDSDSTGLSLTVSTDAPALISATAAAKINSGGDPDGDWLSNLEEYRAGTDPWLKDTDGDGVSDGTEVAAGLNPQDGSDIKADSDGDGVPNGVEAILRLEAPRANPPAAYTWLTPQLFRLDPFSNRDEDGDGIPDDYETVFGLPSAVPTAVFDANEIFAARENDSPSSSFAPFKAGSGTGSDFVAFTQHTGSAGYLGGGTAVQGYMNSDAFPHPAVVVNRSSASVYPSYANMSLAPRQILLNPESSGGKAVLRFTAPSPGNYSFAAIFQALSTSHSGGAPMNTTQVSVLKGASSTVLHTEEMEYRINPSVTWGGTYALSTGESVDFAVAANGDHNGDATGLTLTCFQLLAPGGPLAGVTYDGNAAFAASENSARSNPFGRFTAGYGTGPGFIPFSPAQRTGSAGYASNAGLTGFLLNSSLPCVLINRTAATITPSGIGALPPRRMLLHPDHAGVKPVVRFTAPVPGRYSFAAAFQGLAGAGDGVEVSVYRGTAPAALHTALIGGSAPPPLLPPSVTWNSTCALGPGETLDFAVGRNGEYSSDSTGLTLTVTRLADDGSTDTDGDGLPDRVEAQVGTWASAPASYAYPSPGVFYSVTDENQDHIPDIFEPHYGFSPALHPVPAPGGILGAFAVQDSRDTDGDGAWDGQEILSGSDTRDPEDIVFPSGGGSTGAMVSVSLFQGGYPNASNGAFQWRRLIHFNPQLYIEGRSGNGDGPPLGEIEMGDPQMEYSVLPQGEYDADNWSSWQKSSEGGGPASIFGEFSRSAVWRVECGVYLGHEEFNGMKTRLRGRNLPSRVVVGRMVTEQRVNGDDDGQAGGTARLVPGGWESSATDYHQGGLMRDFSNPNRMHPLNSEDFDALPFSEDFDPFPFPVNGNSSRGTSAGVGGVYLELWSASLKWTAQEFYFGSGRPADQAREQVMGIPLINDGWGRTKLFFGLKDTPPWELGSEQPHYAGGGFKSVALHFSPGLKVFKRSTNEEVESGMFYETNGFGWGDFVSVHPANPYSKNTFRIGIEGKIEGSFKKDTIGPYPNTKNIPTGSVHDQTVKGPFLELVALGIDSSAEPGESYSLSLSEDGGARFRKISLEGLPLGDGKPQTESESDSRADDSYVDALNLTLSHHTSDLHVPVANSDLALSADRSLRQEVYLDTLGRYPPSVKEDAAATDDDGYAGKPFGVCWTSSLTPHIVFEIDADAKTLSIASVVDETGSSLRFAYMKGPPETGSPPVPLTGFIPLPSPSDQTSLLNRLEIVEENGEVIKKLDLKKRFGTVVHYELAGYHVLSNARLRYYFRIGSGTGFPKGVEDRHGNALHYTYGDSPVTAQQSQPAQIASLLIPSAISDSTVPTGRRLVITRANAANFPGGGGAGQTGRFIGSVSLMEGSEGAATRHQRTNYTYRVTTPPDLSQSPGDRYRNSKLVLLAGVGRETGETPAEITQSFDYSVSYDQQADNTPDGNSQHYYAHLWLSRMTEGTGDDARYHRFETVFDRTRQFYYGTGDSRKLRYDQGLERPVSAVFFGTGTGAGETEQLLSEFKLQQAPEGQRTGVRVANAYPTDSPEPLTPPVITGSRVNAVVDADRRIRYYKFTVPVVRDTKAFENLMFPPQNPAANARLQRSVLIAWTRMEIDHTGGAKEVYTFNPGAMMALESSEMTVPGNPASTTRTEWKYESVFKPSAACAFLTRRKYAVYQDINGITTYGDMDDHPFFAGFYPDPTSEIRILDIPAVSSPLSTPASGSRIVKTYKYWADLPVAEGGGYNGTTSDNSKPWSRAMVESAIGHRAAAAGSLFEITRTVTRLNPQGLPETEEIFGPGSTTPDKTTTMSYGPGSFLNKTEVANGVATGVALITEHFPDSYGQTFKTVTGNKNDDAGSTVRYTQRNALGQTLAEFDGKLTPDPADLSASPAATRFIYRRDGRLTQVNYPRIAAGTSAFPENAAVSDASKIYKYDATGRKISETWTDKPDGTGSVPSRTVLNYDARGRIWRTYLDLPPLSGPGPGDEDHVTTSGFSAAGLLLTRSDPSGLLTSWQYDWLRRVISQRTTDTGSGVSVSTGFSYSGYCGDSLFSSSSFKPTLTLGPATHSGGVPAVTTAVYDSLFRKIQESREYLPGVYAVTGWAYDLQGRVIKTVDPRGKATVSTYDKLGNPFEIHRDDTSGRAKSTTYSTPAGLVHESAEHQPAVTADGITLQAAQIRTTRTEYDAAGRVKAIYPPNPDTGAAVGTAAQKFTYDTAGRRLTVTTRQSDAGAGVEFTATTTHDNRGRVWKVTGPAVKDSGLTFDNPPDGTPVTESRYDFMNRPTWSLTARGAAPLPPGVPAATITFSPGASMTVYDGAGRAVRAISPVVTAESAGAPAQRRLVTLTAHDRAGNPTGVKTGVPLPVLNDDTAYGSVFAYTPGAVPALGETVNSYDQRGRLLSTARNATPDSPGDGGVISENFDYDPAGNRTLVMDGAGKLTRFTYDAFGRVLTTTHNAGGASGQTDTLTSAYDGVVLVSTVDAANRRTSYTYDYLHRLSRVTPSAVTYTNLIENHYYDAAGERLAVKHTGNSTVGPAPWRDIYSQYDCRGRLRGETSSGVIHRYEYDNAGNRTKVTYAAGPDPVASPTTPGTRVLISAYDALNRLKTCTENGRVTEYFYDLRGNVRRRKLPNGNTEDKTYDLAGRMLTQITATSAGTVTASTDTGYDSLGNVLKQTETRPAAGALTAVNRVITNTYDGISRLTRESIAGPAGATATAYTYDRANNRTSLTRYAGAAAGGSETYDHAADANADFPAVSGEKGSYRPNQLRKITRSGISGAVHFRYDANGNRVRRWDAQSGQLTLYTWDQSSRLVRVRTCTAPAGTLPAAPGDLLQWDYTYDARSRRVLRAATGMPMEIESFSGGTSVSRWSATGSVTAPVRGSLLLETIRGSDYGGGVGGVLYTIESPLSSGGAETSRFYEYGARGDVTGHSDSTGAGTFRAVYKAFGDYTQSGTPGPGRQRASTKDEESELGLLNEGFRWRDISTGTFLSRDPAGFVDGPNLYSYVSQNPWSAFDPEGLATGRGIDLFGVYIGTDGVRMTTQDDRDFNLIGSINFQNGKENIQAMKSNPIGYAKGTAKGFFNGRTDGSSGGDFGQYLSFWNDVASLATLGSGLKGGGFGPRPALVTPNGAVIPVPAVVAPAVPIPFRLPEISVNSEAAPGGDSAGETKSKADAETKKTLYRGVPEHGRDGATTQAYKEALDGTVTPRGGATGHQDASQHNRGRTEDSAFTSWTESAAAARGHASMRGKGVLLQKEFSVNELTKSPNYWMDQDGIEWLVKGQITGAKVR